MKYSRLIIFPAIIFLFQACLVKNDMSYPRVLADITAFDVEGQLSSTIDQKNRTVNIVLGEEADMSEQKLVSFKYTEDAVPVEAIAENDVIDLSKEVRVTLRTYQDYVWKIKTTQPVERYVHCTGEAKDAQIDVKNRSVTVYLMPQQDIMKVTVEEMKLEAEGSEIVSTTGMELVGGEVVEKTTPCTFPMTLDFTLQRTFNVMTKGEETVWKVSVVRVQESLSVSSVNPWCYHAEVTGEYEGEGQPYFSYKAEGDQTWTDVTGVTVSGVSVTAELTGLKAGTGYSVRIINGETSSSDYTFTTGTPDQLSNMSFDDWYQASPNNTWYPAASQAERIWDSANKGVNMVSTNNPTSPEETFVAVAGEGKRAARLESMKVFGMFAAGNILTGEFLKASFSGGVGAELYWGTPFTARPKSLKGYYSYAPKVIDNAKAPYADKMGTMDKLQILVLLTDWESPFKVITSNATFVDQYGDDIIARGTIETDEDSGGKYVEFECPLVYNDTERTPTHVVVIACASLYGDYFTGAVGSVLYVDEFEFVYD